MKLASVICLRLLAQLICCALNFARDKAGKSIAARIAIMAMTTNSSINVNPPHPPPGRGKVKARLRFFASGESGSRNAVIFVNRLLHPHAEEFFRSCGSDGVRRRSAVRRPRPSDISGFQQRASGPGQLHVGADFLDSQCDWRLERRIIEVE